LVIDPFLFFTHFSPLSLSGNNRLKQDQHSLLQTPAMRTIPCYINPFICSQPFYQGFNSVFSYTVPSARVFPHNKKVDDSIKQANSVIVSHGEMPL
jgi:hypothetical protein